MGHFVPSARDIPQCFTMRHGNGTRTYQAGKQQYVHGGGTSYRAPDGGDVVRETNGRDTPHEIANQQPFDARIDDQGDFISMLGDKGTGTFFAVDKSYVHQDVLNAADLAAALNKAAGEADIQANGHFIGPIHVETVRVKYDRPSGLILKG